MNCSATKPLLTLLATLLLSACGTCPPAAAQLPPPAQEIMKPQPPTFRTELESILSRKPTEPTK
jgi:hypothetical protein